VAVRTQQIDNLKAVPRFFVWAGLVLAGFLVVALVECLISGKFDLDLPVMVPYVALGTTSGFLGSWMRNRREAQGVSSVLTRYNQEFRQGQ
jgi:membrane protein YqaA with SNARE-associated domain